MVDRSVKSWRSLLHANNGAPFLWGAGRAAHSYPPSGMEDVLWPRPTVRLSVFTGYGLSPFASENTLASTGLNGRPSLRKTQHWDNNEETMYGPGSTTRNTELSLNKLWRLLYVENDCALVASKLTALWMSQRTNFLRGSFHRSNKT